MMNAGKLDKKDQEPLLKLIAEVLDGHVDDESLSLIHI